MLIEQKRRQTHFPLSIYQLIVNAKAAAIKLPTICIEAAPIYDRDL